MVSASFDYPQSIHSEAVKICQYKPNIETCSSRGADYFNETLKIPKTPQNKETMERIGSRYVLMALELVQAMAAWYLYDYSNPKVYSFFKTSHEKLLQKKVTFPAENSNLSSKKRMKTILRTTMKGSRNICRNWMRQSKALP